MEILIITDIEVFNYFASIGLWSAVYVAPLVIILSLFKN